MSSNSKRMRSIRKGEDRISGLQDEILCHILSFLPTKLGASTTILSKRWKSLWLSVLSLDFDDQTFPNTIPDIVRFRHYMFLALHLRDVTTPILSLRLKCRNTDSFPYNIKQFTYDVWERGLENLNLDLPPISTGNHLPWRALLCKTLVVIKLKNVRAYGLFNVDLPKLKTLHLDRVSFHLRGLPDVTNLFYGCPILEDLQTKLLTCVMELKPNTLPMKKFEALPNLIKAKISDQYIPIALVREAKFLKANLTIRSFPLDQFPMFRNLTHMELFFNYTTCLPYKTKWNWLIQMLKHCPKLQHLIIHEDFADGNSNESRKDPPVVPECLLSELRTSVVPECLLSELRTCSLSSCKGMDSDQLQFVEYIVRNSKVLETLIIKTVSCSLDINDRNHMLMKSSSWTKGSATCKLLFC